MKKTKIVCTLGPASENKEVLKTLIKAGLNVARFNFSHGDYVEHGARFATVKALNQELGTYVATMLDTKGPEIRTHEFEKTAERPFVEIKKGSLVRIVTKEAVLGNAAKFSVSYPGLYDDMKIGDFVTVDDGYLTLEVVEKDDANKELVVKAKNTHNVKSRRGVNVPNVILNMPFISEKDANDIKFAATEGFDYIAASFTRRAQDVLDIRAILDASGGQDVQIIAKIENQEGFDNLDEIIAVVDGIMVARGDLGIEVPAENVPVYQTVMIDKCLEAGKPVIVATQMLESMQKNPRPTRAEVSDVANAVREGTSATMLSGESAAGEYPLEAVTYMAKIDEKAELELVHFEVFADGYYEGDSNEDALAQAAVKTALDYEVNAILAEGLEVAKAVSKYHPAVPVVAVVKTEKEARSLALNFAVYPVLSKEDAATKIESFGLAKDEFVLEVTKNSTKLLQLK